MFGSASTASARFRHAVSRVLWKRTAFGLAWLALAGSIAAVGLQTKHLECRRVGTAPSCTLAESGLWPSVQHFAPGSVGAVEVFERWGSTKGQLFERYQLALLDTRGIETRLASFSTSQAATQERDRLRAFLADGRTPSLIRKLPPRIVAYLAFAVVVSIGVAIVGDGLSAGRLRRLVQRKPWHEQPPDITFDSNSARTPGSQFASWKPWALAFLALFALACALNFALD